MPEIVKNYVAHPDLVAIPAIYDELLTSYIDHVEKYSKNSENAKVLRH